MKKFIDLNIQRFGSTNKTTHYELSQYIGTDKPTYLGDYNGDMLKIDTAIYNVSEAVSGISGSITVIQGNIGTLANLTTTDKTDLVTAINEVDSNSKTNATNIGTLANLETENKTSVVNAINEVEENIEKFNLVNFSSYDNNSQDLTKSSNVTNLEGSVTLACNSDYSIFKFYGAFNMTTNTSSSGVITIQTPLRPTERIEILGAGVRKSINTNTISQASFTIETDGKIKITAWASRADTQNLVFTSSLYFLKNFGDVDPQQ